ncbi:hypothetical protein M0654_00830 [Rhizobium sp. NTR19]|uniref:Antifreeze protein n=1 Tax=Neorhizobium turbinariae TaxID=2937795 RepID=A0ABT0IKW0_9HYPH|nr:hypothetical protein [Neorhizobium turbinariae]MCK8778515.1 hypothetical protein [Neorhizobium turbinariae]
MRNIFTKAGIAALVTLAGLSAVAPTASAANGDLVISVQHRDRHWRPDRRPDRRPGCAPWLAEEKAARMGLRRVRVVDVSRRTVTVVGFDRRGRDRVVFANVRGCPLIRR